MRSGCRLQGTLWEGLLYARDANTVTKFVSGCTCAQEHASPQRNDESSNVASCN